MKDPRRELLAKVPLFRHLDPKQLEVIARVLERRALPVGKPLAKQGELGHDLCLIESGEIEVIGSRAGGETITLGRVGPGSYFGEIAVIEGQHHRATYMALTPTVCLILSADRLNNLMQRDPGLAPALLRRLSRRVPDADQLWFENSGLIPARAETGLPNIAWKESAEATSGRPGPSESLEEQLMRYARDLQELYARTVKQESELREAVLMSIKMIIQAIEAKDRRLHGHATQVARWARATAVRLGWDETKLAMVSLGGLVHDIGLIAVDRDVLGKFEGYSETEWSQVRAHPQLGAHIVGAISFLRPVVPFVLYHHERLDGRGYPHGFLGTRIPIEGRLMATVETFSELLQRRPATDPLALESAATQLRLLTGRQLDPACVAALLDAVRAGEIVV